MVREALRALADGEPRLVQIGPAGAGAGAPDDVVVAESRCASEGVVEVLIEPELPGPLLAVLGEGWPAGPWSSWPASSAGGSPTSWTRTPPPTPWWWPPWATATRTRSPRPQGQVGYVALVASARRAAHVLDALRGGGPPRRTWPGSAARPAATSAPRPRRRSPWPSWPSWSTGATGGPPTPPPSPRRGRGSSTVPAEAVDPVCGMTVAAAGAPTAVRDGVTWYFCSVGCRDHFERTGGP